MEQTPVVPSPQPAPAVPPSVPSRAGKVWAVIGAVVLVLIAGYFAWAWYHDEWPFEAVPIVVLPSPSPTDDPMAGWGTYTNTKYGYELRYPPLVDAGDSLEGFGATIENSGNPTGYAVISITPPEATTETDVVAVASSLGCAQNIEQLTIGGVPAVRFDGCDMGGPPSFIWIHDGMRFDAISYTDESVARDILATFRFTGDLQSEWTSFEDPDYGISFRYPPNAEMSVRDGVTEIPNCADDCFDILVKLPDGGRFYFHNHPGYESPGVPVKVTIDGTSYDGVATEFGITAYLGVTHELEYSTAGPDAETIADIVGSVRFLSGPFLR